MTHAPPIVPNVGENARHLGDSSHRVGNVIINIDPEINDGGDFRPMTDEELDGVTRAVMQFFAGEGGPA